MIFHVDTTPASDWSESFELCRFLTNTALRITHQLLFILKHIIMKFFIPLTKITSLITIISPALASAVADWSQITATTTVSAPLPQRSSAIGAYDPASNSFCAYGGSGSSNLFLISSNSKFC